MKCAQGCVLHALCCAAVYKIRWLLRIHARGGLVVFFVTRTLNVDLTRCSWALLAALQSSLDALLMTRLARRTGEGFLGLGDVR
jgi:hypothetical protein